MRIVISLPFASRPASSRLISASPERIDATFVLGVRFSEIRWEEIEVASCRADSPASCPCDARRTALASRNRHSRQSCRVDEVRQVVDERAKHQPFVMTALCRAHDDATIERDFECAGAGHWPASRANRPGPLPTALSFRDERP